MVKTKQTPRKAGRGGGSPTKRKKGPRKVPGGLGSTKQFQTKDPKQKTGGGGGGGGGGGKAPGHGKKASKGRRRGSQIDKTLFGTAAQAIESRPPALMRDGGRERYYGKSVETVETFINSVYRFNCTLVERVETHNLMHLR